ncbi:MAG TPA: hypothetical protein VGV38_09705, partial [Pyrinomonadaceae bacterium]|nr:hypothetical protein [Pyrinomonadaceae bacterium]
GADPDEGALAAAEFRRAAADLRRAARAEADTGERRVARRVLGQVFAQFYERAADLRARGEKASAVVAGLELAAELSPDNPQLLFELACAHAVNRDRKKALELLRRAVEKGFADADQLARHDALTSLRAEPAYQELLARIKTTR